MDADIASVQESNNPLDPEENNASKTLYTFNFSNCKMLTSDSTKKLVSLLLSIHIMSSFIFFMLILFIVRYFK